MPKKRKGCGAEGCPNGHYAHGYCQKHYTQIKNHGRLTPESEHKADSVCIEADKPVEAVVKPRKTLPYMTPVELTHSNPDVFWAWWGRTSPGEGVGK